MKAHVPTLSLFYQLSRVVILQCVLSKLLLFLDDIYILIFNEEILETPIPFIAFRTPEIQNFTKCLEIVNESPILLLLNVGTYVKPTNEKYFYKQFFLELGKFYRK